MFCVNLLSETDAELARLFSSSAHRERRFAQCEWRADHRRPRFPWRSPASIAVQTAIDVESHTVFLGKVVAIRLSHDAIQPLLYVDGRFDALYPVGGALLSWIICHGDSEDRPPGCRDRRRHRRVCRELAAARWARRHHHRARRHRHGLVFWQCRLPQHPRWCRCRCPATSAKCRAGCWIRSGAVDPLELFAEGHLAPRLRPSRHARRCTRPPRCAHSCMTPSVPMPRWCAMPTPGTSCVAMVISSPIARAGFRRRCARLETAPRQRHQTSTLLERDALWQQEPSLSHDYQFGVFIPDNGHTNW